ncbi:heterokaryon incompatibility protein-domain-containing protein [Xylogone sp. PMI_703]|nr:heterokaryon incompatibility protein-domain-containing protein [Xylogone sp. PMI_703]
MDPVEKDLDFPVLTASTRAILNKYESSLQGRDSADSATSNLPFIPGKLCKHCAALIEAVQFNPGVGDNRDVTEFEEGARNGCQACRMFLTSASSLTEDWLRVFNGKIYIWLTVIPDFHMPFPQPGSNTPLQFAVYSAKDISHLISQNTTEMSTASPSSLRLARKWIWECWMNHKSCRQAHVNGAYKPTRLLDVSGFSRTIHLREKHEIIDDSVYVTLSHCWGLHVPVKLTTQNIKTHKEGIDLDSLGQTFQDAVEIARQLMVQYIWIDCLCIIQDDKDDWARESIVMQHVYGNSFCNIAATSSFDSRGGCFRNRDPAIIRPIPVLWENPADDDETNRAYLTDINLWWNRFKKMPLNQRAWVVQERLLSPRVLHFDQDQLAWECNDLTACERFPYGTGDLIKEVKMRSPLKDLFRQGLEAGYTGLGIHDVWRPIVRNYSSTKLTRDSDKLVAIYGVAMKIKEIFDCQYAAGLFSRDMESQLTWHVLNHNTTCRPKEQVAPSWSWAAVVGEVDPLPQWESLDIFKNELSIKDQVHSKSPRDSYYCKILNKATLGTLSDSQVSTREVLEILCCIVPCFYATFSEIEQWKECKYEFAANRMVLVDDPDFDPDNMNTTVVDTPLPGEDWPLQLSSTSYRMDQGESKAYNIYYGSTLSSVLVSLVQGSEEYACHLKFHYDIASDFRTARKRWLVPVLESTDWTTPAAFTAVPKRAIKGLVLEQCVEKTPRFRRLGTFTVDESDAKCFWQVCVGFDAAEEWQKEPIEIPRHATDKTGKKLDLPPIKQYKIVVE